MTEATWGKAPFHILENDDSGVRATIGGHAMNRLQIVKLRLAYGLTESQAMAIAALIWGFAT